MEGISRDMKGRRLAVAMGEPSRWRLAALMCAALLLLAAATARAQTKREFRGAWIQCVNGQFEGLPAGEMQRTLGLQLDELKRDGANAIIFQVRPECDALYESKIEPWSRFLTGRQGQAPSPRWDPLEWMVEQCHRRGMELHAWINPYRAKTKGTTRLAPTHVARMHPERTFDYDGQCILNPALPENRAYICEVVADIVERYDIDGLHIDDYFYPYPAAGARIPDEALFRQQTGGRGDIGDWRRQNVNTFVRELHETIASVKPWVKFGISPFGIYRNRASDPDGSDTRGLQNYDDLYADVLLWVSEGWVDYIAPQLYWQIGHPTADYATLLRWWNDHCHARPLFIGEDIERTAKYKDPRNPKSDQMAAKYGMKEGMGNVRGTVLWYAKAAADNVGNYGSRLRTTYWRYPALQPRMPFIDKKAPGKPRKLRMLAMDDGNYLFWTAPKGKSWRDRAARYVVYRFPWGERIDTEDPSRIAAITTDTHLKLTKDMAGSKATYVVTAVDRLWNESKGAKVKATAKNIY